jgi:hypothetical protein
LCVILAFFLILKLRNLFIKISFQGL